MFILHKPRYFEQIVSPGPCFGASHRAIHKNDLPKLEVEYRRLMRDLTDGRGVAFKVVAAREVLVKEGCCEGMHGRVCEHGAPAVDQGVGEGVAQ